MNELVEYDPDIYRIKRINKDNSPNSPLNYSSLDTAEIKAKELLRKVPAVADFIDKLKQSKEFEYVANLTKEEIKKIEEGEIFLGDSKKSPGDMSPNVYEKGKKGIQKVLTLSKKDLPNDVLDSLNNINLQMQLKDLSRELATMNSKLDYIAQGQRDDRVALVFAARQQFIEATKIEGDTELRKLILSQAITTANQARFQLHTALNSDIETLLEYSKNPLRKNDVDKLSLQIKSSLTYINISVIITAKSYVELEQSAPYIETLKSYKTMLDETFYDSRYKNSSYAQALYDNWDIEKYGAALDWRHFPEEISKKVSEIISKEELPEIKLNKLFELPDEIGEAVLKIE